MSDIQTLMRSANPIEDPRTEFGQDDLDALLLLTQQRSGDMDVKEVTTPVTPEKKNRGWLVAAVAFASVIAVAALALVLSRSADEIPPAAPTTTVESASPTTSIASVDEATVDEAPTTTVFTPPELDTVAVAYVQALVDELNAGDAEAAAARVFSADVFEGADASADNQIDERSRAAGRWAVWTALDSVVELIECTTLTSGGTRCEVARTSAFDHSSPDPELSIVQVRFDENDNLTYMRSVPTAGAWNTPHLAFELWIQENHPDLWSTIFFNFSDPEETAALTRDYYARWLEATDSGG